MKDNFNFLDFIGLISFLPLVIPEKYLSYNIRLSIFIFLLIIFLIYKIICLVIINNKKQKSLNALNDTLQELTQKHTELANLFDKRINTIEELKSKIHKNNHLILILEQSLTTAMITNEDSKCLIDSLIKLILCYKKAMEDNNNE
ncbi:hypothetical protein CF067_00820 [Clostridium sporogenes]